MTTRDDVLQEFVSSRREFWPTICEERMADEIVRLRSILAALRKPNDRIVEYAAKTADETTGVISWEDMHENYRYQVKHHVLAAIRAAVTAAEKEM